jgi:hypothetical protein
VTSAAPLERSTRGLLGPGIFVGLAVVVANALNAVFQIALARILDPAEYSLLVALVVITLIAAVPPLAFQAAVAREMAVALAEERPGEAGAALSSRGRSRSSPSAGSLIPCSTHSGAATRGRRSRPRERSRRPS